MGSLGEEWAWSRETWGRGYVNLTKCARNAVNARSKQKRLSS